MKELDGERRRRSRVHLEFPLTIMYNNLYVRGILHDLSLKGLSCAMEQEIARGTECEVTLELDSGLRIRIKGVVVRSGEDGAIDFVSMDEISFNHLRNLVRLYAEDADVVDDELRIPAFSAMTKD
ncbi:MAG: PilZ domain-containing protein [Desulfovibrionales bacterium]|nr:PilZ domain-containing protein [Desulfovibrionales bacterium]